VQATELTFKDGIAAAFRKLDEIDFVPPQRVAHFSWLLENPDIRHRGWSAMIAEATQLKDGHQVTFIISPRIDLLSAGQRAATGDSLLEAYFYVGQSLQYLGTAPNPDALRSVMID
jgi:hypothetical protein